MNKHLVFTTALFYLLCAGCNLEQEIDIELPGYEPRIAVEGYLEAGHPLRLLLTRSAPYFADFSIFEGQFIENTLVPNAEVRISYNGRTFLLENGLVFDSEKRKIYNYWHPFIVPEDYEASFVLDILTESGDRIKARTQLLRPVPIDSLVVEIKEQDTLSRVLTYLTDPPGQSNFYRRTFHKGGLWNTPEQDFPATDRIVEDLLLFGTGFDYAAGDTVISTVYHIDSAYYNFIRSIQNAELANGNPFAQPTPVLSNVKSENDMAIGIFTGLSYSREVLVIER